MPKVIREYDLWPDHPFQAHVPVGLTVRRGEDASGRALVIVHNSKHKAFSFPLELVENGNLPGFFQERLKTL